MPSLFNRRIFHPPELGGSTFASRICTSIPGVRPEQDVPVEEIRVFRGEIGWEECDSGGR